MDRDRAAGAAGAGFGENLATGGEEQIAHVQVDVTGVGGAEGGGDSDADREMIDYKNLEAVTGKKLVK